MISEKRRQEALQYGKDKAVELYELYGNHPYSLPKDAIFAQSMGVIAAGFLPAVFPRGRTYTETVIKEMRKIAKGAATRKVMSIIKSNAV